MTCVRFLHQLVLVFIWVCLSSMQMAVADESIHLQKNSPFEVYQSFRQAIERLEQEYERYTQDKTTAQFKQLITDLGRVRQLFDLSEEAPATRVRVGNNAIAYLYDILARLPPLEPTSIPGFNEAQQGGAEQDLPARWTIPGTDIQIARIEEGPQSGHYLFAANSIAHLPEYYAEFIQRPLLEPRLYSSLYLEQSNVTGPLIPAAVAQFFPDWLQVHYFNTPAWKILIVGLVSFLFLVGCVFWVRWVWRRALKQEGVRRLVSLTAMPLGLLLWLKLSDSFITNQINPVGSFAKNEGLLASVLYYGLFAWLAWLVVYLVVELLGITLRANARHYDEALIRLLAKLAVVVIVAFILLQGADQLGIPALGLLAGFGVGGIAVALAAQSTVENIFGGLSLFADRPFSVGDKILFNQQSAQVLRIGPRSTRLRTRDGALCSIPNSDLAKMHIINFSLRSSCYLNQTLALHQDSDPEQVAQLLVLVRQRVLAEPLVEQSDGWPRVQLVGVTAGRIEICVRAIVLSTDYSEFLSVQEAVMLDVLRFTRCLGLKLAQPALPITK